MSFIQDSEFCFLSLPEEASVPDKEIGNIIDKFMASDEKIERHKRRKQIISNNKRRRSRNEEDIDDAQKMEFEPVFLISNNKKIIRVLGIRGGWNSWNSFSIPQLINSHYSNEVITIISDALNKRGNFTEVHSWREVKEYLSNTYD